MNIFFYSNNIFVVFMDENMLFVMNGFFYNVFNYKKDGLSDFVSLLVK